MGQSTRLTVAALVMLLAAAAPAAQENGRAIYEAGQGREPGALTATMGDPPRRIAPEAAACAACHGPLGFGSTEGGIAAPALANASTGHAGMTAWLASALRDGRGRDGRSLSPAMPRYAISESDLGDLAAYVRTLPYPMQPGISPDRLSIALDLDGAGFTDADRVWLRDRLGAALRRVNEAGGLFGRRLLLAPSSSDALITIGWHGLATSGSGFPVDQPTLSILARPPGAPHCRRCCGSLHADLDTQVDWLARWLQERKRAAAFAGSLATKVSHPRSANAPAATVVIAPPQEAVLPPTGAVYLFADLGSLPAPWRDRPDSFLVSSFDLRKRAEAVIALMRAELRPVAPGTASAAVELDNALALVMESLRKAGRRVSQAGLCLAVRRAAAENRSFTVLDVHSGDDVTSVGR